MTATEEHSASRDAAVGKVDVHLEVEVIAVSDIDRGKELLRHRPAGVRRGGRRPAAGLSPPESASRSDSFTNRSAAMGRGRWEHSHVHQNRRSRLSPGVVAGIGAGLVQAYRKLGYPSSRNLAAHHPLRRPRRLTVPGDIAGPETGHAPGRPGGRAFSAGWTPWSTRRRVRGQTVH